MNPKWHVIYTHQSKSVTHEMFETKEEVGTFLAKVGWYKTGIYAPIIIHGDEYIFSTFSQGVDGQLERKVK